MTLDYSSPGAVKIDMTDYVKAMIDEFPEDLKGKVSTPANDHLLFTKGRQRKEAGTDETRSVPCCSG